MRKAADHNDTMVGTDLDGRTGHRLGQFCWNKGATLVDAGTLAVMNNMSVPVGLLLNLLIWGTSTNLVLLAVGGTIILASLRINRLGQMKAR